MPRTRRLAAGLSPQRLGFDAMPVDVRFVEYKVALGTGFSPNTSVFPCQYHATNAPYSFSFTCCSNQNDKHASWERYGNRGASEGNVLELFWVLLEGYCLCVPFILGARVIRCCASVNMLTADCRTNISDNWHAVNVRSSSYLEGNPHKYLTEAKNISNRICREKK